MKLFFSLILIGFTSAVWSQKDTILPAYKRYPTLPALQLLLSDSATKYTKENIPKKKAVMIMLFNPECEHCQHEAEQIVANKEDFRNIHIIMATTYPIYRMKEFAEKYGLAQMENVVMAKDPYYLLPAFYEIRNLPYLAFYNKKGNLINTFEGSLGIDKILQLFEANK